MPPSVDEAFDEAASSAGQSRNRSRWRFGLLTLILLVAATASWTAYVRQRENIRRLEVSLGSLREVARELVVEDHSQYAAVRMLELSMEDFRWKVHLPAGHRYTLQMALHEIDSENFPPIDASARIAPGVYAVELRYDQPTKGQWKVVVLVDGKPVIEADPGAAWSPAGSSSGGTHFDKNAQQPLDKPLVLFRRRFHGPAMNSISSATGPSDGVLLYIEASSERREARKTEAASDE